MQIRIRESSAVMYIDEFRRLNAGTSFPQVISEETLNDFGADVVFEGPQASGGTVYQYSQPAGVEQIDGKWYTKYILGPVFTDTPAVGDIPAKTAAEVTGTDYVDTYNAGFEISSTAPAAINASAGTYIFLAIA